MTKFGVGILTVAVGLALSACGGIHPGEAVVVDDTSFSMQTVDDLSTSFCVYALVSQQSQQGGAGQDVPGGAARQQAAKSLIELDVAKQVASRVGASVPPSQYVLTDKQLGQIRKAYGAKTADLRTVVEMLQRTGLLYTAIGAEKAGVDPDSSNSKELASAGQKTVEKAIKDADISIDPRFGLSDDAVATDAGSGSLSVGVSSLSKTDVSDYGAAQRCS